MYEADRRQIDRRGYDTATSTGLVGASPKYPALRRRFHTAVVVWLLGGVMMSVFFPWWTGAAVGLVGAILSVWTFRRGVDRLDHEMRLWLRDKAISGRHLPEARDSADHQQRRPTS